MWYYFKQTLFFFVYLIFMAMISLAITAIGIDALEAVLFGLCIAMYTFIVCSSNYKDGQEAVKLLQSNNMRRKQIIQTGEYIEIKKAGEFRPWKGFLIGFIVVIPLVVMLIVHLILHLSSGGTANGAGAASGIVYMLFYAPYSSFMTEAALKVGTHYFYLLYAVPYMMIICGVPYLIGAKKMQKQYDRIEQQQQMLYGDEK